MEACIAARGRPSEEVAYQPLLLSLEAARAYSTCGSTTLTRWGSDPQEQPDHRHRTQSETSICVSGVLWASEYQATGSKGSPA